MANTSDITQQGNRARRLTSRFLAYRREPGTVPLLQRALTFSLVLFAIIYVGPVWLYTRDTETGTAITNRLLERPYEQILRVIFEAGTFGLFIIYWRRAAFIVRENVPIFILAAWCALSWAWSEDKPTTGIVSRELFFMVASCVVGLAALGQQRIFRYIISVLSIICVVSIALYFVMPAYAVSQAGRHFGQLHGLFYHKNAMGYCAFLLNAFSVIQFRYDGFVRRLALPIAVVGVAALGLAGSASADLASVSILTLAFVLSPRRRRSLVLTLLLYGGALVVLLAACIAAISVGGGAGDYIGHLVGRDITLTGRTTLWSYFAKVAMEQPMLGFGYGTLPEGHIMQQARLDFNFPSLNSPHNGYLAIVLQLGLIGLIIFGVSLAVATFKAIGANFRNAEARNRVLLFLPIYLAYNCVESLVEPSGLGLWSLFLVLLPVLSTEAGRIPTTTERPSPPARRFGPANAGARK